MTNAHKKILIVEDSKNYLWILSQALLAVEEITIATAGNGEEGLAAAEKEKPDLILLDITMPKMDGITMAKKLKEAGINTPIIFLTNMSDAKHISDAADTAKDYIVKADASVDDIVVRVKERLNIK